MYNFKDAFISYSRRNLDFARKLYITLAQQGLDIWFDQNDIPLAVDFQNQIDEGINKAHNFIFIISPASIQSGYCAKELARAIACGKRIIPILHEMPNEYELRYIDSHIEKLNWIYIRENIDNFEEKVQGILSVMELYSGYVQKHTELLLQALEWEEHRKNHKFLLINKDRKAAEQWLNQEFADLPPCTPPDLVCEFICESRENAENLLSDVYIASTKEDRLLVSTINKALQRYGATTWTYDSDFKIGTNYETTAREGIEGADNFILLISNHLTMYDDCMKELEYAISLNKRIIPIVIDDIEKGSLPPRLRELQTINISHFVENKEMIADALFSLLDDDTTYHQQHKILLVQALKWQQQNYNQSILLRGYSLESAETWLRINKTRKNQAPTALQAKFIEESSAKKGQLNTEVFISYSRADSDFARLLNSELQIYGKTTWFDQENITSGADFQQEIYNGIASSDNFVFIISPESVNSPYCAAEVEYAKKLNKRFITIKYRQVEDNELPKPLRTLQWIDAMAAEFHHVFSELIRALDTDRTHVQQHTRWANKADEWLQKEKDNSLLLRGNELELASLWLKYTEEKDRKPTPTDLQKEFILASETAKKEEEKRKKGNQNRIKIAIGSVASVAILAIFYFINDQIDIKNLKKEREKYSELTFELTKEREILRAKEDSLNALLGHERTKYSKDKQTKDQQLKGISTEKMSIESLYVHQRRRADSLQNVITKHYKPVEGKLQRIHDLKKELDAINFKLSQFVKFNDRLKKFPAELDVLQDIVKRFDAVEKELEVITK
jgi:hypothetical protein